MKIEDEEKKKKLRDEQNKKSMRQEVMDKEEITCRGTNHTDEEHLAWESKQPEDSRAARCSKRSGWHLSDSCPGESHTGDPPGKRCSFVNNSKKAESSSTTTSSGGPKPSTSPSVTKK